jgi:hypothetical protein
MNHWRNISELETFLEQKTKENTTIHSKKNPEQGTWQKLGRFISKIFFPYVNGVLLFYQHLLL